MIEGIISADKSYCVDCSRLGGGGGGVLRSPPFPASNLAVDALRIRLAGSGTYRLIPIL